MMPTLHSVRDATRNFLCNAARTLWRHEDFSHVAFSGGFLVRNAAQPAEMTSHPFEDAMAGVAASAAGFHVARFLFAVTRVPQMAGMVQQDPAPEPTDPKQEDPDVLVVD